MKFSFSQNYQKNVALLYPVFLEKKKLLTSGLKPIDALLQKLHQEKHFEGRLGEVIVKHSDMKNMPDRIVFFCLGDQKKINITKILNYVGSAVQHAKKEKGSKISFFLPKTLDVFAQTIAEALIMANYNPAIFKTGKSKKKIQEHDLSEIIFVTQGNASKAGLEKGRLMAEAVNTVRGYVNSPPNIMTPEYLENEAKQIAEKNGYALRVFNKKDLQKMGMNTILAVNRGSSKEAKLIVLEHWPAGQEHKNPVVLAGKGIIFDSGGYNLKPTNYIENMHLDMSGAASVLGVFMLLKKFNIPFPVVGVMPVTENLIDANAVLPSEIITSYNGKTIEITNTDAEGRLILADALAYSVKEFKPRYLLDIATLTGSCMVALGDRYAGLFGNDKTLMKLTREAGKETDELVWPLPMHPDYKKALEGEISDLKNGETGPRYAGAAKAAFFLQEFVGKSKWVHLDIAGPAYTENPKKYEAKRGTGFGVRLFMKLLEKLAY